jgi:hypothetical protein
MYFTDRDAIKQLDAQREWEIKPHNLIPVKPQTIVRMGSDINKTIINPIDLVKVPLPTELLKILKDFPNFVIAGSSVTAALIGSSPEHKPDDIDIFIVGEGFKTETYNNEFSYCPQIDLKIKSLLSVLGITNPTHTDRSINFWWGDYKIQIIKNIATKQSLLTDFDITAAKFMWRDGYWTTGCGKLFLETGICVVDILKTTKSKRVLKYYNKGYTFYFPFTINVRSFGLFRYRTFQPEKLSNERSVDQTEYTSKIAFSESIDSLSRQLVKLRSIKKVKSILEEYKKHIHRGYLYRVIKTVNPDITSELFSEIMINLFGCKLIYFDSQYLLNRYGFTKLFNGTRVFNN